MAADPTSFPSPVTSFPSPVTHLLIDKIDKNPLYLNLPPGALTLAKRGTFATLAVIPISEEHADDLPMSVASCATNCFNSVSQLALHVAGDIFCREWILGSGATIQLTTKIESIAKSVRITKAPASYPRFPRDGSSHSLKQLTLAVDENLTLERAPELNGCVERAIECVADEDQTTTITKCVREVNAEWQGAAVDRITEVMQANANQVSDEQHFLYCFDLSRCQKGHAFAIEQLPDGQGGAQYIFYQSFQGRFSLKQGMASGSKTVWTQQKLDTFLSKLKEYLLDTDYDPLPKYIFLASYFRYALEILYQPQATLQEESDENELSYHLLILYTDWTSFNPQEVVERLTTTETEEPAP